MVRGREVGWREVEGSAVWRRKVGMPCGFASERTSENLSQSANTKAHVVIIVKSWQVGGNTERKERYEQFYDNENRSISEVRKVSERADVRLQR